MQTELERDLSDLLSCPVDDVEESYDRILETFADRAGVGLTTFFRCVEVDGEPHYDGYRCTNEPDADAIAESLDGQRVLEAPTLDFEMPNGGEVNGFIYHDTDGPSFRGTPVYEHFLEPNDIHSAARIMVYRGDEFVGWLGCFRRGDQPRTNPDFCQSLQPMAEPVCAAVSNVERLQRQQLAEIDGAAVLAPDGHLEFASPQIRVFLDERARERLAGIVRDVDAGDVEKCVQLVGGIEVRVSRLEGNGMLRYLAQFVPPSVPDLDPMSELTPAQREVAEFAVSGATNAEIAEATDRSKQTVKVHLRNIYERLGIGSRVELVRKLK